MKFTKAKKKKKVHDKKKFWFILNAKVDKHGRES